MSETENDIIQDMAAGDSVSGLYYAIIKDCRGETISPPFATRKDALQYAEREVAAAREIFPDNHVGLRVTIIPK